MSVLDLIKASRPAVQPVEISVGTVYIREMDGHQFEALQRSMRKDPETGEQATMSDAQLASMVLCEQEGIACFPTPEAGVPYMLTMKASDLRKLAAAALKSAGLTDTAEERAAKEKKSLSEPNFLFWHRLALAMGEPNVEKLQASISVSQLEAWQLYWKCEPWGYQRATWLAAQQQATTVNCTPRGEHAKAVKASEFVPKPYQPPEFEAAP